MALALPATNDCSREERMRAGHILGLGVSIVGVTVGACVLGWLISAAVSWLRFGRAHSCEAGDPLLDRFIPVCDVNEVHETTVDAPAANTYSSALALDFQESAIVRAIFRGREILLRSRETKPTERIPFVRQAVAMGWGLLAEVPERQMIFGAITKPWEADVRFRPLPPEEFASFDSAGWVKIVWTLAVDSVSPTRSRFRTVTRVLTTDANARARFRRYWAVFSPGILIIRREALRLVRRRAEQM